MIENPGPRIFLATKKNGPIRYKAQNSYLKEIKRNGQSHWPKLKSPLGDIHHPLPLEEDLSSD